jgi:CubicO group peptidase (beta-lactamase class C family)
MTGQLKIAAMETAIGHTYANIAGIVVQKNGRLAYENYFNGYDAADAVHVASVTKSIFSALIGIAIDKGFLSSIDSNVLTFFPEYAVLPGEETIQKITVRHLLTMTAPYKYETEPYEHFFESQNPIRDALDLLGGTKPVGAFHYAAIGGPQILAGILARTTGQSVLSFANDNLFLPLEVTVSQNIEMYSKEAYDVAMHNRKTRGWAVDGQGINTASWGLFLSPIEMAKIGQLYLNGGNWHGTQIIPAAWVAESTREQSRCVQWGNLGYGFLWWYLGGGCYAAMGDGGNVIYVNPIKDMVVAIASIESADVGDRIAFIKEWVEPLFEKA